MTRKPSKIPASKPGSTSTAPDPPWLAWAMGGLGIVLVLGCLSVILWRAMSEVEGPDVQLRLIGTRPSQGQWLAEIEARNLGGETAAEVEIEGRLGDETASAVVDYLPASGRRTVILGFSENPEGRLEMRTRGWIEP